MRRLERLIRLDDTLTITLYWAARRASSCAEASSGTPARTLKPSLNNVCAMRIPACPVAPATNTVEGSLRLGFPKEKPGAEVLLGTGIREIFPKSKRKGLELDEPSFSSVEEEESSLGLPSPKDGNDPDFLAKTLSLGFRRVTLEWGVLVIKDELDVRVGAMDGFPRWHSPFNYRLFWILCLYFLAPQPLFRVVTCDNYYLNGKGKPNSSQLAPAT